jgi:hypothetical protein
MTDDECAKIWKRREDSVAGGEVSRTTPMKNLFLAFALILTGCATPKQIILPGTPSLYLAEPCDRFVPRIGPDIVIHFPAGEYRAAYRDDAGIYYRAVSGDIVRSVAGPVSCTVYVENGVASAVDLGTGTLRLNRPIPLEPRAKD